MPNRDADAPAWKTDLGAYTRKILKPYLMLDEPTVQRVTALLKALEPLGWSFEDITSWAKWQADAVKADASLKKPGAVFAKRLDGGSPKQLPKAPRRVNPEGASPDADYRERVRANTEACSEVLPTPILLIQGRGRMTGDYVQGQVDVSAEYERQGRPLYWDLDTDPFEESGACACEEQALADFKHTARRMKADHDKREAKYGPKEKNR